MASNADFISTSSNEFDERPSGRVIWPLSRSVVGAALRKTYAPPKIVPGGRRVGAIRRPTEATLVPLIGGPLVACQKLDQPAWRICVVLRSSEASETLVVRRHEKAK